MVGAGRCDGCNAAIAEDSARCEFCGAPVASASRDPGRESAFELIRTHPAFTDLTHRPPSEGAIGTQLRAASWIGVAGAVLAAGVLAIFVVVAGGMSWGVSRVGGGGWAALPFVVVGLPLLVCSVFVFVAMSQRSRLRSFRRAPVRVVPAVVVAKRTHVTGGESARTTYFVTLEMEDTSRLEVEAPGPVFGGTAEGDPCAAVLRGGFLVDLRHVPLTASAPVDRPRARA